MTVKEEQESTRPDTLSVSVAEAARLLGVSSYSIRNYIRRGELSAIRLGRRVLLPLDRLRDIAGGKRD